MGQLIRPALNLAKNLSFLLLLKLNQNNKQSFSQGIKSPTIMEWIYVDGAPLVAQINGKESLCNAGDPGSIPGWGRSPGEENGYPFQYSCLENSVDRETWWARVHGVTKSWT